MKTFDQGPVEDNTVIEFGGLNVDEHQESQARALVLTSTQSPPRFGVEYTSRIEGVIADSLEQEISVGIEAGVLAREPEPAANDATRSVIEYRIAELDPLDASAPEGGQVAAYGTLTWSDGEFELQTPVILLDRGSGPRLAVVSARAERPLIAQRPVVVDVAAGTIDIVIAGELVLSFSTPVFGEEFEDRRISDASR